MNDLWQFNPSTNQWTWVSGSNTVKSYLGQPGSYGTIGVPSASNVPGGRDGGAGWVDSKGDLWLFGGFCCETEDTADFPPVYFNDIWRFDPTSSEWTWMGGSNVGNQSGAYGTQGNPATTNFPGGRKYSSSWNDSNGNFWLFGGYGYDSVGNLNSLNDLWEFNSAQGEWTWVGGSSTVNRINGQPGVYGSQIAPAATNIPGSRIKAASWTDGSGNLWLFGGYGTDATGAVGELNDLWKFNPSTGQWTWVSGSTTIGGTGGQAGNFGTWMTPSQTNAPGGRQAATAWSDKAGNLWLFGGLGYAGTGTYGQLGDLWEFNPTTNEWTWMGGSADLPANYGSLQTTLLSNTPGGRNGASGWKDSSGNLWLFGGSNARSTGVPYDFSPQNYFNDLWKFQLQSDSSSQATPPMFSPGSGTYSVGQTVTMSDSTPGASIYYLGHGSYWPMPYTGPFTLSSSGTIRAIALAPNFANSTLASATYTVPIAAAPAFSPASGTYTTQQTVTISDATAGATIYYTTDESTPTTNSNVYSGPFLLAASGTIEAIAVAPSSVESAVVSAAYVMWPTSASNQWAWMAPHYRSTIQTPTGVYGTLGVPSAINYPGGRSYPASWTDSSGNFWLFGGQGLDANGFNFSYLNDLWMYSPAAGLWTWMGGSSTAGDNSHCYSGGCGRTGSYGTLGVAGADNVPGARMGAASWSDKRGNFWLLGGYGYDSSGILVYLNDFWKFSKTANQWTWMGGSSTVTGTCFDNGGDGIDCAGLTGIYGTLGVPSVSNIPGGRYQASTWADSSGNLWLFGGYRIDNSVSLEGYPIQYLLNDLWKYSPTSNQWTWIGGSNSPQDFACVSDPNTYLAACGQPGVYGTVISPSQTNMPGGRSGAATFVGKDGSFWLIGGAGFDGGGSYNPLNDVWKLDLVHDVWTWMGGASVGVAYITDWNGGYEYGDPGFSALNGSPGTQQQPAAGTIPTLLSAPAQWTDSGGNFWLFGGIRDDFGTKGDDLYTLNPSANEWTWMTGFGPASNDSPGQFGPRGQPSAGYTPGARAGAANWVDQNGNMWLFGGYGSGYDPPPSYTNDLWQFHPSAPAPVPSFAVVDYQIFSNAAVVEYQYDNFSVAAGSSESTPVQTIVAGGFDGQITLSASNLPSGLTVTFNPAQVSGFATSQATFSANLDATPGDYTTTVTGTSGTLTESVPLLLTIGNAPPADFTLTASPGSLTVHSGGQGTVTLSVSPEYGFNSAVTFACTGLPIGAACSFSPSSLTPKGAPTTTTVTVTAAAQSALLHPVSQTLVPATALAFGVCFIDWRRRLKLRIAMMSLCWIACGLLSSCGGSNSGSGGGTNIVPVTSTVTVTATSTFQHSTTFSLTLN